MKKLYTILYVKRIGNEVLLGLIDDTVSEQLNPMSALDNVGDFVQQMQMKTSKATDPDKVTIPFDEWKKHKYNIGNFIEVDIVPGGK